MKIAMLVVTAATSGALPATAHAEPTPPCANGQVQVSNGGEHRGLGHRDVILTFSLSPGTAACTLTGYPGVDSGVGVTTRTRGGRGRRRRRADPYRLCPTYTDLRVTPPDTTETVTVPIHFGTCPLEVHPVNATP